MTPEAIQRINELHAKAKAQGLTPEEAQEQKSSARNIWTVLGKTWSPN